MLAATMLACRSSPEVSTPPPALTTHEREPPTCTEAIAALDGELAAYSPARPSGLFAGVHTAYPAYPGDRDGDGYNDDDDGCPDLSEDFDAFEDEDGCPDCDNDKDGIPDADTWSVSERQWVNRDTDGENDCRNDSEDFDGDRDEDGCPEIVWPEFGATRCDDPLRRRPDLVLAADGDRDEDRIGDLVDACPELPEDIDGFEDGDGCPDCDNDKDGVLDAELWVMGEDGPGWANHDTREGVDCRDLPEDLDGDQDEDGCPDP